MKINFPKTKHEEFKKLMYIKETQSDIEKKYYKKTEKYIKYIKWIPWIQMVWIWNSLSMNCSKKSSDIDLLIVTTPNKMWTVRIISTFIFQILGVRKTSKKHAWRFCLSFFCTTNWMNFWDFSIKNDIYLYFWIVYFRPILDYNNTYNTFIKNNKNWANFDEYKDIINDNKKYIKYKNKPIPSYLGTSLEKGRNLSKNKSWIIEKIFKKIFLSKTLKNYNKLWKPYWIIINDDMLKFHNNDKRKEVRKTLEL